MKNWLLTARMNDVPLSWNNVNICFDLSSSNCFKSSGLINPVTESHYRQPQQGIPSEQSNEGKVKLFLIVFFYYFLFKKSMVLFRLLSMGILLTGKKGTFVAWKKRVHRDRSVDYQSQILHIKPPYLQVCIQIWHFWSICQCAWSLFKCFEALVNLC